MRWLKAVIVGGTAGFVGGLFGVGGGIILVPGLVLWLGLDQYRASGTSVTAIVAPAGAALLLFAGGDSVDVGAAVFLFIGAGTGAWLGTRYLTRIPEHVLAGTFVVLLTVAAVRLWI